MLKDLGGGGQDADEFKSGICPWHPGQNPCGFPRASDTEALLLVLGKERQGRHRGESTHLSANQFCLNSGLSPKELCELKPHFLHLVKMKDKHTQLF